MRKSVGTDFVDFEKIDLDIDPSTCASGTYTFNSPAKASVYYDRTIQLDAQHTEIWLNNMATEYDNGRNKFYYPATNSLLLFGTLRNTAHMAWAEPKQYAGFAYFL